ncbi:MAG: hypothetical protein AAF541_03310 [Pseudomonadota bacterium]
MQNPSTKKLIGLGLCFSLSVVFVIETSRQVQMRLGMVQTHIAYTEAYRISRDMLVQHSVGAQEQAPESSGAWISRIKTNTNDSIHLAPGGGPAFILNNQGNSLTGAIGVTATNYGRDLILTRPAFYKLSSQSTTIRQVEVVTQAVP